MTFIPNWEEFEKSAEMLYLRDPINTRYSMKYSHSKGLFLVKITDNKKHIWRYVHPSHNPNHVLMNYLENLICIQFKTEVQQDVRKIDKFITDLMRHMASNDK